MFKFFNKHAEQEPQRPAKDSFATLTLVPTAKQEDPVKAVQREQTARLLKEKGAGYVYGLPG